MVAIGLTIENEAITSYDFGDTLGWHIELPCESSSARIEFFQLFGQMFSGESF